jgi:hypothetical protein
MSLNTSKKAQIGLRRKRVAQLRAQGRSQREIAGMVGASVGTISTDLKVLMKQWREEASVSIREHASQQLAEVREVKRMAWMMQDLKLVLAAIRLEAYITGTVAAPVININISMLAQLAQNIESQGLKASDVFSDFMQRYAANKRGSAEGEQAPQIITLDRVGG